MNKKTGNKRFIVYLKVFGKMNFWAEYDSLGWVRFCLKELGPENEIHVQDMQTNKWYRGYADGNLFERKG